MVDWTWIALGGVFVLIVVLYGATGPKTTSEASAKEREKADAKPEQKPEKKADAKPEKKADAKPEKKADAKPEKKAEPVKVTVKGDLADAEKAARPSVAELPKLDFEESEEVDPTKVGQLVKPKPDPVQAPTKKILYDEDAASDEPTHSGALILVTATAQTDRGLRRKRNEDSLLALDSHGVFVVADGMGGYTGGEIASALAVETIQRCFMTNTFDGPPHDHLPKRASELARAIHSANEAIRSRADANPELEGMGTTIVAARFSPAKQRFYVGHVGDSRMYRLRGDELTQLTSDHTMKDLGVSGPAGAHLSRAVGVWPAVPIDIILGKPSAGDVYLLCSDGLTKMVSDKVIGDMLRENAPAKAVEKLIGRANESGGKDNITVIVVRVDDPARPGPS